MVPIYVVIGTRAQFIKVAPLLRMMKDQGIKYTLIFTAQHRETIDEILKVYDLPSPDVVLYKEQEANTKASFVKWFLSVFPKMLFYSKKYLSKKGVVITHGDTFTTWMAALMGKLAGCKVAHMESGLRSFNLLKPFPEELSRVITFHLSDYYYCPYQWAVDNLKKHKGEKINLKMNPMYDGVVFAMEHPSKDKFEFQDKKYAIVSIHRYENIFTSRFTQEIIPYLKEISKKIYLVMTLHPTTRERLQDLGLFDKLKKEKNILLHERFDFLDWISVCNSAEFIITDGGSNQSEMYYLGLPTILFRTEIEQKEGIGKNIVLSKLDKKTIDHFVDNYEDYRKPPLKVKHSPSQIIINHLKGVKI